MAIWNDLPSMAHGNKTARTREPVYEKNENQVKGKCQLILDGHVCNAKIGARGLCGTHYRRFFNSDDKSLIEKYGTVYRGKGSRGKKIREQLEKQQREV